MHVPMPLGEVVDRMAILNLKVARLPAPAAAQAHSHLTALMDAWTQSGQSPFVALPEWPELQRVNTQLWEVEDALRAHEVAHDFGPDFVEKARQVYVLNDERARLKGLINTRLGSPFTDPKSHRFTEADVAEQDASATIALQDGASEFINP